MVPGTGNGGVSAVSGTDRDCRGLDGTVVGSASQPAGLSPDRTRAISFADCIVHLS
ncbi:hypothetical protein ALIPUT_01862 [Alistipes putredinis DSM 17216]|uniref:Uncharacterized protein n=1 Tax=Alistipes putredinis DSM 17216 TaxID=445970 RepID=B0MXJ9_9BACT|nr:hypothetical protein ALIPUT_01862 [Alistipes putredinis DSM 17216]